MRASRQEKIRNKMCSMLRARFEQIFPKPIQGLFNYRCFENSVQYALNSEKDLKIFEVIFIDGGYPVLHYIVKDDADYLEVTIGWRAEYVEFYLVREVPKDDWKAIGSVFEASMEYWLHEKTNWFDRAILRIDRVV